MEDAEIKGPPDDPKLKVMEEVATVSKRDRVTGRVRVTTSVEHFEDVARATLHGRAVEVTRIRVDKIVDESPQIRTEGDVTIVPVVEEILVVEKRLVLTEEVHIRTVATTEMVEQSLSLRRQSAVVERLDESGARSDAVA